MVSLVTLCLYGFVLITSAFLTDNGGVSAAAIAGNGRIRRQLYGSLTGASGSGLQGILGYRKELFNSNGKSLTGFTQVSKNFLPNNRPVIGAGLDFTAPRGSISVGAQRQPGAGTGTSVQANANANLWKSGSGRTSLDANANFGRTFGGLGGTSKPNIGGGFTFTHRF